LELFVLNNNSHLTQVKLTQHLTKTMQHTSWKMSGTLRWGHFLRSLSNRVCNATLKMPWSNSARQLHMNRINLQLHWTETNKTDDKLHELLFKKQNL